MTSIAHDLRLALRRLLRQGGSTAVAVSALALGIGFTAAMFSILRGTLLRGLPFEQGERLVSVGSLGRSYGMLNGVSLHDFHDWRERQTSFEDLAAHQTFFTIVTGPLEGGDNVGSSETHVGAWTNASLFGLLRVRPFMGRFFTADDEAPGAPLVAVVGHEAWSRQFERDPRIIGKTIKVNRQLTRVVGVAPEGFRFPYRHQVWMPLRFDPARTDRQSSPTLGAFGRLRDGVSPGAARAELDVIAARLAREHSQDVGNSATAVAPYVESLTEDGLERSFYTGMIVVFAVLLIACANVANLLLARAAERSREVAVRTALGAGRRRIAAHLLAESALLAAAGGLGGLLLAQAGVDLFNRTLAESWLLGFWIDVRLDPVVLAFVGVLIVATAVVAGLVPALRCASTRPNEVLNDASRGSAGPRLGRLSRSLVVVQVALSCALLVAAGLLARTLVRLGHVDDGIVKDGVFTATISTWQGEYGDDARRRRFFDELERRVSALPDVEHVAFTTALPFAPKRLRDFAIEGRSGDRDSRARWIVISPSYFDVFGVAVSEGRGFDRSDLAGRTPVVVVNRDFANRHFPGESPLGRRIRLDGQEDAEWARIVGVVPDVTTGPFDSSAPVAVYAPLAQHPTDEVSLAARGRGAPLALAPLVRREVAAIDSSAVVFKIKSMSGILRRQVWSQRVFGAVFSIFGAAAVALAAIGLYGVMAFAVRRRRREMGVRLALGALPTDVVRLVLARGLRQVVAGLVLGMGLALYLVRFLDALLYEVNPRDAAVYGAVAVALAAVGCVACWAPARRASRVDPMEALRYE